MGEMISYRRTSQPVSGLVDCARLEALHCNKIIYKNALAHFRLHGRVFAHGHCRTLSATNAIRVRVLTRMVVMITRIVQFVIVRRWQPPLPERLSASSYWRVL